MPLGVDKTTWDAVIDKAAVASMLVAIEKGKSLKEGKAVVEGVY